MTKAETLAAALNAARGRGLPAMPRPNVSPSGGCACGNGGALGGTFLDAEVIAVDDFAFGGAGSHVFSFDVSGLALNDPRRQDVRVVISADPAGVAQALTSLKFDSLKVQDLPVGGNVPAAFLRFDLAFLRQMGLKLAKGATKQIDAEISASGAGSVSVALVAFGADYIARRDALDTCGI